MMWANDKEICLLYGCPWEGDRQDARPGDQGQRSDSALNLEATTGKSEDNLDLQIWRKPTETCLCLEE